MSAGVDFAQDRTDGDNTRRRYWNDAYGTLVATGTDRVTASIPDGTFANYAGFTSWEWYAGPQWTVHAGGRFTHYRYRTEYGLKSSGPPATYFQPLSRGRRRAVRLTRLVYALRPTLHLSANVANGLPSPTQDLFFEGPASVGTVLGIRRSAGTQCPVMSACALGPATCGVAQRVHRHLRRSDRRDSGRAPVSGARRR
jgi:outer membrane receptor protein involved in Fe transport